MAEEAAHGGSLPHSAPITIAFRGGRRAFTSAEMERWPVVALTMACGPDGGMGCYDGSHIIIFRN